MNGPIEIDSSDDEADLALWKQRLENHRETETAPEVKIERDVRDKQDQHIATSSKEPPTDNSDNDMEMDMNVKPSKRKRKRESSSFRNGITTSSSSSGKIKYPKGTKVAKIKWIPFEGKITSTPKSKSEWYHVVYDDGDEEDMDQPDVEFCVNAYYQKYPTESRPISNKRNENFAVNTKLIRQFPEFTPGKVVSLGSYGKIHVQFDDDEKLTVTEEEMNTLILNHKAMIKKLQDEQDDIDGKIHVSHPSGEESTSISKDMDEDKSTESCLHNGMSEKMQNEQCNTDTKVTDPQSKGEKIIPTDKDVADTKVSEMIENIQDGQSRVDEKLHDSLLKELPTRNESTTISKDMKDCKSTESDINISDPRLETLPLESNSTTISKNSNDSDENRNAHKDSNQAVSCKPSAKVGTQNEKSNADKTSSIGLQSQAVSIHNASHEQKSLTSSNRIEEERLSKPEDNLKTSSENECNRKYSKQTVSSIPSAKEGTQNEKRTVDDNLKASSENEYTHKDSNKTVSIIPLAKEGTQNEERNTENVSSIDSQPQEVSIHNASHEHSILASSNGTGEERLSKQEDNLKTSSENEYTHKDSNKTVSSIPLAKNGTQNEERNTENVSLTHSQHQAVFIHNVSNQAVSSIPSAKEGTLNERRSVDKASLTHSQHQAVFIHNVSHLQKSLASSNGTWEPIPCEAANTVSFPHHKQQFQQNTMNSTSLHTAQMTSNTRIGRHQPNFVDSNVRKNTGQCSCPPCQVMNGLRKCGGCNIASYCSTNCQSFHWPIHHKTCSSQQHEGKGNNISTQQLQHTQTNAQIPIQQHNPLQSSYPLHHYQYQQPYQQPIYPCQYWNMQQEQNYVSNTSLNRSYQQQQNWGKSDDSRLQEILNKYKTPNDHWEAIAREFGNGRTAKECNERWIRYLKPGARKGKWKDHEDAIIIEAVTSCKEELFTNWSDLAQKLPGRVGKQIRARWVNYLNPNINHMPFTKEDDMKLWEGHKQLGKKFVEISTKFFNSSRSENQIKNRWYSASFEKFIASEFGLDAHVTISKEMDDKKSSTVFDVTQDVDSFNGNELNEEENFQEQQDEEEKQDQVDDEEEEEEEELKKDEKVSDELDTGDNEEENFQEQQEEEEQQDQVDDEEEELRKDEKVSDEQDTGVNVEENFQKQQEDKEEEQCTRSNDDEEEEEEELKKDEKVSDEQDTGDEEPENSVIESLPSGDESTTSLASCSTIEVGTKIAKSIMTPYHGQVTSVPSMDNEYYHVNYDDGDEEDLEFNEVEMCVKEYLKHHPKSPERKKLKRKRGEKFPIGTRIMKEFSETKVGEITKICRNRFYIQYKDGTVDFCTSRKEIEQLILNYDNLEENESSWSVCSRD